MGRRRQLGHASAARALVDLVAHHSIYISAVPRLLIVAVLVASSCAGTTVSTPSTTATTSPTTSTASSSTTTNADSTTNTDPDAERQSGIRFTELLSLDRIGTGDGAPVVILVHGGGWYGGDRSSTEPLGELLADEGFVVINTTYRTSAGGFPESVEDVVCATIAGRSIAAEAGGTGPVILVGHSAGAHLASLVALAGDRFPPRDCGFEGSWQPVDGFVGLAGPYKIQNLFGTLNEWMGVSRDEDPELWASALPETYVDQHLETAIRLVHGDADRVANISFSRLFADELGGVEGRNVELIEIPAGGHSSMLAPLIDAEITVDAIQELVDLARMTSIEAAVTVQNDSVIIDITAAGFEIDFERGDTSGDTGHIHAYTDRDPPEHGEEVPLGAAGIVHSTSDRLIVSGLGDGDHVIWIVVADGSDRVMIPPAPIQLSVTIGG